MREEWMYCKISNATEWTLARSSGVRGLERAELYSVRKTEICAQFHWENHQRRWVLVLVSAQQHQRRGSRDGNYWMDRNEICCFTVINSSVLTSRRNASNKGWYNFAQQPLDKTRFQWQRFRNKNDTKELPVRNPATLVVSYQVTHLNRL